MAFKQQVAVADIVKTLLATNQQIITKQEALQCFDEVFRQAMKADQVLDEELTQAHKKISPDPETASSQRSSKRRKTTSKIASEEPSFPHPKPSLTFEPDEIIRCVCNSDLDNGAPWICCEICSVWQHMNCMRLLWTAEEAEKQNYMCEKCAPAQHWDVLTMLKQGTWDPLPFKSIEDEIDQCEEDVGISKKENKKFNPVLRERDIKAESRYDGAPPVSRVRSIQMVALQQRLQDARTDGDDSLAARIAADIRNLEQVPAFKPSGSPEAAPLQIRGEDLAKTGAAHTKNITASTNASPTGAAEGSNAISARERRHSINGGSEPDIFWPTDAGRPVDGKKKAYSPPEIDLTVQQLGRRAARKRSG